MVRSLSIKGHSVGTGSPCFLIAEIGINHGGNTEVARQLIKHAALAGASAVKFQTYVTEKRVSKDSPIFDILKRCELSPDDQRALKKYAEEECKTLFFSTPFDEDSVTLLESMDVALYKVASFDITNLALLRKIAATRKPVIISTGMASASEVQVALGVLRENPVALLHCVSAYPTPANQADLNTIHTLLATYPHVIGYSDHTLGVEVPALAVAAGARIIEKHFTLDTKADGPDHALSADPTLFAQMAGEIQRIEGILGIGELRLRQAEQGTAVYRRLSA
jgi:N,N'-diacetyllegionaminate synthase